MTSGACTVLRGCVRSTWSCLIRMFPEELKQGEVLPSCFGSHTVIRGPFQSIFSASFSHFFVIFIMISLFEMAPKHRLEVLPSVSKHRKIVMHLTENMC